MNENKITLVIIVLVWFMYCILIITYEINIQPGKFIIPKMVKFSENIKDKIRKLFQEKYSIISWFSVALIIALIIIILPMTISKTYQYTEIVENVYPEIYGLLFDVILFGIILSIYQISTERKKSIESEMDIIDDFRGWDSNEASHRILGSVKRLQRLNICKIDLRNCWFKEITLEDLSFVDSKMTSMHLYNTKIYNTIFQSIQSNIIHFRDSAISGCSFEKGKINFNLHSSNISSTLFHEIDISSSTFFVKDLSFVLFNKVNFSY